MARKLLIVSTAVLVLGVTAAFGQEPDLPDIRVGIDADAGGNTATQLGTLDVCREVTAGTPFDVDIWVRDLPAAVGSTNGLIGFAYNFLYDPTVVNVLELNNELMIAADGPTVPFEVIDADPETDPIDPLPSTRGNLRVDYVDLSQQIEGGNGVLSRLTLEAVGAGQTRLELVSLPDDVDHPLVLPANSGFLYPIPFVQEVVISVDGPCSVQPTPRPVERPYGALPRPSGSLAPTATTVAEPSGVIAELDSGPRALPRTGGQSAPANKTAWMVIAASAILVGGVAYVASRRL